MNSELIGIFLLLNSVFMIYLIVSGNNISKDLDNLNEKIENQNKLSNYLSNQLHKQVSDFELTRPKYCLRFTLKDGTSVNSTFFQPIIEKGYIYSSYSQAEQEIRSFKGNGYFKKDNIYVIFEQVQLIEIVKES